MSALDNLPQLNSLKQRDAAENAPFFPVKQGPICVIA